MTTDQLKQKLLEALHECKGDYSFCINLIEIIVEQRQALEWCYDHWNSTKAEIKEKGFVVTRDALTSTDEALKRMGVE